jgi:hypothetical protein
LEARTNDKEDALIVQSQIMAVILDRLAKNGVRKQDFSSEDFVASLPPDISENLDYEEDFESCVDWLRQEGFLTYSQSSTGTNDEPCFYNVVATAKCFKLLEIRVPALGDKNAKEVLAANTSGDADSNLFVKSGAFLGGLLASFTKTLAD